MACAGNVSHPPMEMFPGETSMLDVVIPGYSVVSRFLSAYLRIDISFYLSLIAMFTAVAAALKWSMSPLFDLFSKYCTSTAEIRLDDEMYDYLMAWISQQPFSQGTRCFVAGTKTNSELTYDHKDEDDEEERHENELSDVSFDFDEYWAKRMSRDKYKPLRCTPADGRHFFKYKGRYLVFTRERDEDSGPRWVVNAEKLYVSCLGRDPSILKELLHEAQQAFVERDGNRTVIYRGQKNGDQAADWVRCMTRHPRPLSTVVLDHRQKQAFIEDVKEYLHPMTRRWYSNRGIPYRRGYIFHGPPGTGKTSLCFAAAGLLGLKIYLVNLNSKSLNEDGLADLFHSLPRRCIVLLEDVDSAGITHNRGDGSPETPDESPVQEKEDASKGKSRNKESDKPPSGISLSALLNIIDGVASSEGRILVMTTNHIEKLDPALLRPGRVDMSIAFGYSDKATIQDLYRAIYGNLEGELQPSSSATFSSPVGSLDKEEKVVASRPRHKLSNDQVTQLAADFASRIPSGEFSPAEIQGYLLNHKHDPEKAARGAEAWVQSVRAEHEKKKSGPKESTS